VAVDAARKRELRLIAHLFLISAITMVLLILYLFAHELKVAFPAIVIWIWIGAMLVGWAASWIFGSWVTWRNRRWWWFTLAVFPPTSVPAGVAYAWNRRMEIEHEVFGD
jgi:hypothetical protein